MCYEAVGRKRKEDTLISVYNKIILMKNIFHGLGVALITPFKQDGSIDYDALKRLIDYHLANGANFFCILATTGENPCLTAEEKRGITQFVKAEVAGRVPILRYCGGNHTAAVIEEIRQTDWEGIDGILSICPYYNKPTQEGIYQHFKAIAAVSPLPIILYNVPSRVGVNMTAETTLRIANDCPNVVGIKEASGDLAQVEEILKHRPAHFEVISGDDAITFPLIASGAIGVISVIGNVFPCKFSKLVKLTLQGRFDEARKIQFALLDFYKLLFVEGNPAGCKAMLSELGLIENVLRLPLVPVSEATHTKIRRLMKSSDE